MRAKKFFIAFKSWILMFFILSTALCLAQEEIPQVKEIPYKIYPEVNEAKPNLPSPFRDSIGDEYVIAVNKDGKYAIIPVTLGNDDKICKQLIVDEEDFPELVKTGLHSEIKLNQTENITGWSIEKITKLGQPGGLSHDGFMASDEDILSVIKGDNQLVKKLGFTHPQMAKPLFHVLNMMDADLDIDRWNMAKHRWDNIQYFFYNKQKVLVEAHDTKGGQKSIFNDGIEGAFYIKLWREPDPNETKFLEKHYKHLDETEFTRLKTLLYQIETGEIEPQYIMRYGFYEGHTNWRTDPISISFIFGMKSLKELNKLYSGRLDQVLSQHHTK